MLDQSPLMILSIVMVCFALRATTVDDKDDVDDETFNMDDGMQLIVYIR